MRRLRIPLFVVTVLAAVQPCFAETLSVTAVLNPTYEQMAARTSAQVRSNITVDGRGDRIRVAYSSPAPIQIDLAPMRRGTGYDPAEILHATLPAGTHEAVLDLTATPGWSPFSQTYFLFFYGVDKENPGEVTDVSFAPWTLTSLVRTAARNLLMREEYQVATFHALRGTHLLGFSLSLVLGLLTLIATLAFARRSPHAMLAVLATGMLVSTAWFGIDLARFTVTHVAEWYAKGTYAKAGALKTAADLLKSESSRYAVPLAVHVCSDETDYYAKVLRYFAYPVAVSVKEESIAQATHVLVAGKWQWAYDKGTLTCGGIQGKAREIATFADGSVLFASIE